MFGKKRDSDNHESVVVQVNSSASYIAPDCSLQGLLTGEGDVKIDGKIDGSIQIQGNVNIGEPAYITATIKAKNIQVSGEIRGNLQAEELIELTSTARVYGDLLADQLRIERGARFIGKSGHETESSHQANPEPIPEAPDFSKELPSGETDSSEATE